MKTYYFSNRFTLYLTKKEKKHGILFLAVVSLMLLLLLASSSCRTSSRTHTSISSSDTIDISEFRIIYGADATETERNAAIIFANTLSQITGIDFNAELGNASGSKNFLIGTVNGIDTSHLGEEGFRFEAINGNIAIAGGRPRGVIYGVFRFLEKYFDCGWFTEDFIVIPQREPIMAKVVTYEFIPPLEYRQTNWLTTFRWRGMDNIRDEQLHFSIANGLNDNVSRRIPLHLGGAFGYQGRYSENYDGIGRDWCHTLSTAFVSVWRWFDTHPEWFSWRRNLNEGQGGRLGRRTQLCLTNQAMRQQMLYEVRAVALRGVENFAGGRFIISLSQDDNQYYCQCPECEYIYIREGSQAGVMIDFVNYIAAALEDEFPMLLIDTFAYQYTRRAPRYIRPRDNVIVRLATIEGCFAHPFNDPNCSPNRAFANDLRSWSAISNNLYIWDYSTNFMHFNAPFPNFHVMQANMQFFVENNVRGIYSQGNQEATFADSEFAALRGFLTARLMFNPNMDFEAEMRRFLKAWYGAGWQYIERYINLLGENAGIGARLDYYPYVICGHMGLFSDPTNSSYLRLDADQISYADRLWEEALRLAGDSEFYRKNILRSQLSWRFWKAVNVVGEFATNQIEENKRLYDDFEAFGIIYYHENWTALSHGGQPDHHLILPREEIDWSQTPMSWHHH